MVGDLQQCWPSILHNTLRDKLVHARASSKLARNTEHPLFRIHHPLAVLRDKLSRLVRRKRLFGRRIERQQEHSRIQIGPRNHFRPGTNRDQHRKRAGPGAQTPR